jgi:hypothetical protein
MYVEIGAVPLLAPVFYLVLIIWFDVIEMCEINS